MSILHQKPLCCCKFANTTTLNTDSDMDSQWILPNCACEGLPDETLVLICRRIQSPVQPSSTVSTVLPSLCTPPAPYTLCDKGAIVDVHFPNPLICERTVSIIGVLEHLEVTHTGHLDYKAQTMPAEMHQVLALIPKSDICKQEQTWTVYT